MITARPVPVSKGAFAFCRYSLAALLWIAFFIRHAHPAIALDLLVLSAAILALSAVLTVQYAPLVALYTHTLDRIAPSPKEMLDVNAMRFAHILGTVLVSIPAILIATGLPHAGWAFLFFVAIAKTAGALGFCGASKLYACATSGGSCCSFLRRGRGCCGQ